VGLSLAGLYLVWVRHTTSSGLTGALAISLNGLLILAFAVLAWRTARARQFAAHRGWAMRLYLTANAQWFFRVGLFAWIMAHGGRPVNFGAFSAVWGWGCYLLPLAVLELYLRSKDSAGPRGRLAMASGLVALTALMALGTLGFSMFAQLIVTGAHQPNT
jgi:hypothetical protein